LFRDGLLEQYGQTGIHEVLLVILVVVIPLIFGQHWWVFKITVEYFDVNLREPTNVVDEAVELVLWVIEQALKVMFLNSIEDVFSFTHIATDVIWVCGLGFVEETIDNTVISLV